MLAVSIWKKETTDRHG